MPLPPILLEDDSLLAFDKPSGLPVVPDRWDKARVHLMALVHEHRGANVANVHRLDSEASGVLLCAKTKPALDFLSGQFQSKTAARTYHALVVVPTAEEAGAAAAPVRAADGGLPPEFTIELVIGPDEEHPGRMRVMRKRDGPPSLTRFRTLQTFGSFAWVECRPETGRMHQIRLHLAAAGLPILGDPAYGLPGRHLLLSDLKRRYKGRDEEKPLVARMALHASELGFTHPLSRLPAVVRAPLPNDLLVALKYLRKFRGPSVKAAR